MDRRTFLKLSAMAAATTAATRLAHGEEAALDEQVASRAGDQVEWDKAPCRFCGVGCTLQVGVDQGRVVAVSGDKHAEVNKGLACVKGCHVGSILYGRDRLQRPQKREGDEFVDISWEEAINIIADRIEQGPKGFGFYGSGQWTIPKGYAVQKFMRAGVGSNHLDPNARLCMASAVTGFLSVYGVDEPAGTYTDLDECDVLIMWGNNPAEMHPVLFSRVVDRRTRGEEITLIDLGTRRTRTTAHCQHYMEFEPNTDLAIANGIAHLLIKNGTYDEDFVGNHCNFRGNTEPLTLMGEEITFEKYKESLERYTPEYVEEISGVAAADIRLLGELFGNSDLRITSLWCMGMNQHTRGTAINALVHGIHLLSGHFGRPGDAPTSLTGQPSACGTVREVGTLAHALPGGRVIANEADRRACEEHWNVPEGRIPAEPGHHTLLMWEKFCTPEEEGGDLHTLWVQVTNPGQSLPNLNKIFYPARQLEEKFLIVSDVYPTATTKYADLILPSAMWVEKSGVVGNSERRTQQWFKMVEPPGQAREDVWQVLAVARQLYERGFEGMRDKDGEFLFSFEDDDGGQVPVWDYRRFHDVNVDRHLYEDYRPFTMYKQKDVAPYDELVRHRGLRWPVVQSDDGTWEETEFRFAGFDDPYVEGDKEFQFYHSPTDDDRALIWFHPYETAPEEPDEEYPLWLCTGRVLEHWHTGTMTMRVPQLRRAMPQAYVEMHRRDARELKISNGETVILETRRGSMKLPVWFDGRGKPPRGSVFVPFFDERMMINDLTLDDHDPHSRQPDYKKCAARIRRIDRRED